MEIIVVDDGSSDGLNPERLGVRSFLQHPKNLGKGAALKTGMNHASKEGYTHAITLDADRQHDPVFIPSFQDMIKRFPSALVIGARNLTDRSMPIHRMLSNNVTSLMLSLRTGERIFDAQVGYRAYPLNDSRLWDSVEDGFQFESDVFIKASKLKYGLAWQSISVIYSGERSNMNYVKDTLRFIRTFLRSFIC